VYAPIVRTRQGRLVALSHQAFVKIPSRKTSCKISNACSSLAYEIGSKDCRIGCATRAVPPAFSLLMGNLPRRQRVIAYCNSAVEAESVGRQKGAHDAEAATGQSSARESAASATVMTSQSDHSCRRLGRRGRARLAEWLTVDSRADRF
jgi:hypothetical protein